MMQTDTSQRITALSSIALIVLVQIERNEILKTIILAGIGGLSSYLFTIVLKFLISYFRKRL